MVGRPSVMPDDFQDYFVDWLAGDITQAEIAERLDVRQSTVSSWIKQYKDMTGLDRGNKDEGFLADSTINRYLRGEISQREGGKILGVSHTMFGDYVRKRTDGMAKKGLEQPQEADAIDNGIDDLASKAQEASDKVNETHGGTDEHSIDPR